MEINTSLGAIPVRGVLDDRPRILCITGMFSPPDEMALFSDAVGPKFAGLVAKLPGHGGPPLREASVEAFGRAFDELAEQLNVGLVVGLSAGALVALAMNAPKIRAVVAVDPPLETAKMWMMTTVLEQTFEELEAFNRNVLGYAPDEFVGRCYLDLLDSLQRPTYFLVGSDPLFPYRRTMKPPSLVDEPTRRLILTKPLARLRVVADVGHSIRRDAPRALLDTILEACAEAFPGA